MNTTLHMCTETLIEKKVQQHFFIRGFSFCQSSLQENVTVKLNLLHA